MSDISLCLGPILTFILGFAVFVSTLDEYNSCKELDIKYNKFYIAYKFIFSFLIIFISPFVLLGLMVGGFITAKFIIALIFLISITLIMDMLSETIIEIVSLSEQKPCYRVTDEALATYFYFMFFAILIILDILSIYNMFS